MSITKCCSILIATVIILLTGCCNSVRNPFWFHNNNYYYVPEIVKLNNHNVIKNKDITEVKFFGYEADLLGKWTHVKSFSPDDIQLKNGNSAIIIMKNSKEFASSTCNESIVLLGGKKIYGPSEPCLAPKNWREYFYKFFFLTLEGYEDVEITKANYWDFYIIHQKTLDLEKFQSFIYYTDGKLEAFRKIRNANETDMSIFPSGADDIGHLTFIGKEVDDDVILSFLNTLKKK